MLLWVWLALFLPNMLGKEASMSRYPQWAAYKARTGMLLPRLRRPAARPEDSDAAPTRPAGGLPAVSGGGPTGGSGLPLSDA